MKLLVSYCTLARFGNELKNWPYSSKKMPRTRAQRRATQGPLGGLNDDALRRVLTFLSVADSRRSAGGASKALRGVATSNDLTRLRGAESYVLRGSDRGVVHGLATAFGTREWRRVSFTYHACMVAPQFEQITNAAMPPSRLRIIPQRRLFDAPVVHLREDRVFPFSVVDRDSHEDLVTIGECCVLAGTLVEFQLPFQLQLSSFRLGHASCTVRDFRDWVFEAFDGERWHVLYECGESPWVEVPFGFGGPAKCFDVDGTAVASSRFRLRMLDLVAEHGDIETLRCLHIRDFELFGTVLPPWSV